MKTLSIGGRLTLLKSVLGSMPIFHMFIFKVPSGVLRMLESICNYFFNGHDTNSKKASWVNWKKVLASKESGGLGVSSLYALNRGLMFKWIWRFHMQESSLWVRVIKAIHGVNVKELAEADDESMITTFKKDFIIEEPVNDLQTLEVTPTQLNKFRTREKISFNMEDIPKSDKGTTMTDARRTQGWVTEDEEQEMFGEDAIPRPPGAPRKSKAQRSTSSTSATFGSQKEQFTELMQQQINLDREAKKEHMERELAARLAVCEIQKINDDLKILTFDTTGMNPEDAAKIEALKEKTQATYFNF
ncbi:hypothetical protein Tco_0867124 [Tanacetum coccineum]